MGRRTTRVPTIALLTCALVLGAAAAPSARAMTTSGEESTSRSLVAAARRDAGRPALRVDGRLDRIARAHSAAMAERGAISHSTSLGAEVSDAGIEWRWVGENVGVGPDARMIHRGFMDSPSHRDVLLKTEGNAIGVGAALGTDGRLYVTQVFAKIVAEEPAPAVAMSAPMRAAPAVAPAAPTPQPKPVAEAETPDPNVVIGGIVPAGVSVVSARVQRGPSTTRSGLRAS
jgi:uncharacterized protein YkwD